MGRLVILKQLIAVQSLTIFLPEVSYYFVLLNLSTDFVRPTHIVEHNLQF